MRWKNSGLPDEFHRAHPRLQAMALYLDAYAQRKFGHDLFVTDVERTQEEYDFLYKTEPYLGPRPHLGPPSHAIDFRTNGELTEPHITQIVEHMNSFWPRKDSKPTALYHDIGAGSHLHLQAEV